MPTLITQPAPPYCNQQWDDCGIGLGCNGWEQFAASPYALLGANNFTDGSSYATAFANAAGYWNGSAGTAAGILVWSVPQNFPSARLVPYRFPSWDGVVYAQVAMLDRNTNGTFSLRYHSCSWSASYPSQAGHDLAEIYLYEDKMGPPDYRE